MTAAPGPWRLYVDGAYVEGVPFGASPLFALALPADDQEHLVEVEDPRDGRRRRWRARRGQEARLLTSFAPDDWSPCVELVEG